MSNTRLTPQHLSILIVDDDPDTRSILRLNLEILNFHKIREVSRAQDVVTSCAQYQPHVIFLDIDLDGSSGLDLIKDILGDNKERHIVMVSAHSTLDNIKRATNDGARGFIVKPFTMAKVRGAIENACEGILAAHQENA